VDAKIVSSQKDRNFVSRNKETVLNDHSNPVFTPLAAVQDNAGTSGITPGRSHKCRMVIRKVKSEGAAPEMYSIDFLPLHENSKDIPGASLSSEIDSYYHVGRFGRMTMSSDTFSEINPGATSSYSSEASTFRRSTDSSDAFTDIPDILSPSPPGDGTLDLAPSSDTTGLRVSLSVDRPTFLKKSKMKRVAKMVWKLRNKGVHKTKDAVSCTDRTTTRTEDFSEPPTVTSSESSWEEPPKTVVIDTVTSRMETTLEVLLVHSCCDRPSNSEEVFEFQEHLSRDDANPPDDISDAFTWTGGGDVLLGLGLGNIWSKASIVETASSNSNSSSLRSASSNGEVQSKFSTTLSVEFDGEISYGRYRNMRHRSSSPYYPEENVEVKLLECRNQCEDDDLPTFAES